ncbi:molybdate ABC transporter substrate-binding protein [Marinilongibacter aquaticus]|uniref:molybdate ABC transporter substrate-binding protein n=1 Tax=Marinilongibacter aquaticus TaxID=2975157 RepID=UPI0021BD3D53|nr:molybdate ABC transporter substrate-binding protein [Marinilongibacter aquaticus]UBM59802.1 molybdate ABC transporter substrate-binding protein [Marinilongibacter aquaticus]
MRKTKHFLFLFLWIILSHCQESKTSVLRVATAANMQFAMDSLVQNFEQETGIQVETIIGSSGKLTAQIEEGAPFDIFISADMKYPETLYAHGKAVDKPKVYAKGQLVLWTAVDKLMPDLEKLENVQIKHIALANPKTAPYGRAAEEVLRQLDKENALKDKFVYGESIAQTNQFILSKTAELGFTAKSVVFTPKVKNTGHWISISDSLYSPIEQGVVILKQANGQNEAAERFYTFLFSDTAKKILKSYGYSVNE